MRISTLFKSIAFIFFATFFSFSSFSQNIIEGYWGVKGGLNIDKISGLKYNNNMMPGFHFGVFANFQLSEKFSIQHEILYTLKGVSLSLNNGVKYQKTFPYLDLPWMLSFCPNRSFFISAGLQPSIYAHFKTPKPDTINYNKDNVNTMALSYLVGASFIGKNNLGFGVRFTGSFFSMFELYDEKNKNYLLQAFVLYAVNKKKGRKRH